MINKLKFIFITLLVVLVLSGCKEDPGRHLKLGHWYSQKGLVDEAILEYREVTRLLPANIRDLDREEYEMLAKAHYKLALLYTKKDWWDYALKEAETSFELLPTREYYEIVTLLKKRLDLQESDS